MNNDDFPFGYEFVKKAALREINFGENDMTGEKVSVAGVDEVRKGSYAIASSMKWRIVK